tara:strand:- start:741 stop:1031 length:291 start_codon:yes stop_codon:yes gene_type:complete
VNHKRAVSRIKRLLTEHGELDTATLYDRMRLQKNYAGKLYNNVVPINQLTNLLSKNKIFEKCNHTVSSNNLTGSTYEIAVWKLRGDEDESKDPVDN